MPNDPIVNLESRDPIEINVGDTIIAPLYGNKPLVVTDVEPRIQAATIVNGNEGEEELAGGGTISGSVEINGHWSLEKVLAGITRQWVTFGVPMSDEMRQKTWERLQEQAKKGPVPHDLS